MSTESGIPGYRNADGQWKRMPPVFLKDFLGDESMRRRYWARSMVGWPIVANARPNIAHHALAQLQAADKIERLVTQNVDGLHQRAGSSEVIELHGNVDMVRCIGCGADHSRQSIQQQLQWDNPDFLGEYAAPLPDGDADLPSAAIGRFVVPQCHQCGGVLKPSVVFFGEGVPRTRVDAATKALECADAMLVVGSSLMVYSGFRFCEWAGKMGKPIAAINLGRTRADHLFVIKIEQPCGAVLSSLVGMLTA